MTRAIKFRAWYENIKKMMVLGLKDIETSDGGLGSDEVPVMQFTGLLDKNGKEIYEGDIVQSAIDAELGDSFEVRFHDGGFKLFALNNNLIQCGVGDCNDFNCSIREIIGNIYQNPELVK